MKENEAPKEEKLVVEALRKTEELFKRISENPQGGRITLENSTDSRAVLYRALLREKAALEKAEAALKEVNCRADSNLKAYAQQLAETEKAEAERDALKAEVAKWKERAENVTKIGGQVAQAAAGHADEDIDVLREKVRAFIQSIDDDPEQEGRYDISLLKALRGAMDQK